MATSGTRNAASTIFFPVERVKRLAGVFFHEPAHPGMGDLGEGRFFPGKRPAETEPRRCKLPSLTGVRTFAKG